ncbi:cytochrome b [Sphingomonas sp. PvP055]|uniref:cytochrome b/b6 domain-containing protein n=1 Tax=Sphingomonas sp. PvP055 TaxID=3156391 RepID=UPI0033973509
MASPRPSPGTTRGARVWDVPIRLFHWLLVALLGFSWWSGEQHLMDWHRLSGLTILALLLFRLYWGLVGSPTARFARFVRGPHAVLAYVRGQDATPAPGHNPLGGWSVVAMLVTLCAMVGAGLFAVDVDGLESGPLADYVSFDQGRLAAEIHGWVFNALLALVAVHVVAIVFYLVRGKNLTAQMITGRSQLPDPRPGATDDHHAWLWKAVLGAAGAAAIAIAVARGFRF